MASPIGRRTVRTCLAAVSVLATMTAALVPVSSASASSGAAQRNPYSPAYKHHYRHGAVPTRETHAKMTKWARQHNVSALASNDLNYGGGVDGIGVTTGKPQVYLVFWGSQWGTASTNSSGYTVFSRDSVGSAAKLQGMFKGLGTNNELWSGVNTQYCEGVAAGAQTCPTGSARVGYPTGGALAGVWADTSAAEPSNATAAQLAQEAVKAASHFGNTTAAANRNAQYVILSASGAHPDGVTIVEGHEYSETITDQNPAGGWTDSSGAENMDKCAWKSPGTTGGAANLSTATGSYAMQGTWSNLSHGCAFTHAIVK